MVEKLFWVGLLVVVGYCMVTGLYSIGELTEVDLTQIWYLK